MEQSLTESPKVQQDSPVRQFPNANNAPFLKGRKKLLELRREGINLKIPGAHQMSITALEVAIPIAQAEQALAKQEPTQEELDVLREEQLGMAEGNRKPDELYQQLHNEPVLEFEQEQGLSLTIAIIEFVPPTWRDTLAQINLAFEEKLQAIKPELEAAAQAVILAAQLREILESSEFDWSLRSDAQTLSERVQRDYHKIQIRLTADLLREVQLEISLATMYRGLVHMQLCSLPAPEGLAEFFEGYNPREQAFRFVESLGTEGTAIDALMRHKIDPDNVLPVW